MDEKHINIVFMVKNHQLPWVQKVVILIMPIKVNSPDTANLHPHTHALKSHAIILLAYGIM